MTRLASSLLAVLLALLLVVPALAADKAIIILDASGSMWAQIDGKTRIEIARSTLKDVLKGIPDDLELGFMAYGHRSKGDCKDIQMLVDPAAGTGPAIAKAAAALSPKGKTPLSDAVRQAAEQLRYTENKATVILITDGLETCNADPCAVASALAASGVDFKVDVIGLALSKADGDKVRCLADNTGGLYLAADDAKALTSALSNVVTAVVTPTPPPPPPKPDFNFTPVATLSADGPPLKDEAGMPSVNWAVHSVNADGSPGDSIHNDSGDQLRINLDPGSYIVEGVLGLGRLMLPVNISADTVAAPVFDFEEAFLDLKAVPAEGGDPDPQATLHAEFAGGAAHDEFGEIRNYVPAGTARVSGKIGTGLAEEQLQLPAGATVNHNIVVGVGRLVLGASYAPGVASTDGSVVFQVLAPDADAQGNHALVVRNFGPTTQFDVGAGSYLLETTLDQVKIDQPVTIAAGDKQQIDVALDAGLLDITTADGNDTAEVLSGTTDAQGQRISYGGNFGPKITRTLPVGTYHVLVKLAGGAGTKEGDVTITAGNRTAISTAQ